MLDMYWKNSIIYSWSTKILIVSSHARSLRNHGKDGKESLAHRVSMLTCANSVKPIECICPPMAE